MCSGSGASGGTAPTRAASRALAAVAAAAALAGCGGPSDAERDEAISLAKEAYADARARGLDLSRGPCLGVVRPGWVADVAHDPRLPVDDEPQNQCEAFRSGEASHFVELDPEGELIRTG